MRFGGHHSRFIEERSDEIWRTSQHDHQTATRNSEDSAWSRKKKLALQTLGCAIEYKLPGTYPPSLTKDKKSADLGESFDLYLVDVQCKVGGSDCGFFALAFTVSLCIYKEGSSYWALCPDRNDATLCLVFCGEGNDFFSKLQQKEAWKAQSYTQKKVLVFCICRLPWYKYDEKRGPLVQCSYRCREWYHQNCSNIEQDIVNQPSAEFTCNTGVFVEWWYYTLVDSV